MEVLKKSKLFSGLDDAALEEMLAIYRRETWPKRSHLPPWKFLQRQSARFASGSKPILHSFLPYLGEKTRVLENLSADLALFETAKRLAKLIMKQATPGSPLIKNEFKRSPLINTLSDEAMTRMIGSCAL